MTEIILLAIGILLIVININAIKKSKNSFSQILDTKAEDIKDYDVKIMNVRREFSETILELQKEIETLKARVNIMENNNSKKELADKEKTIDKDSRIQDKNLSNHYSQINISTKSKNQKNVSNNINKNTDKYIDTNNKNDTAKVINEDTYDKHVNNPAKQNHNSAIDESRNISKDETSNINVKEIINKNEYENNKVTDNNIKIKEITKMLEDGLSVDEISKIIGMGKGEVLLIKELYIK